jgi:acetyl-CoA carboxylase alpha subunit
LLLAVSEKGSRERQIAENSLEELEQLTKMKTDKLIQARFEKFASMGAYNE